MLLHVYHLLGEVVLAVAVIFALANSSVKLFLLLNTRGQVEY